MIGDTQLLTPVQQSPAILLPVCWKGEGKQGTSNSNSNNNSIGRERAIEALIDREPQGDFYRAARVVVSVSPISYYWSVLVVLLCVCGVKCQSVSRIR
jgi:hypothetical protein